MSGRYYTLRGAAGSGAMGDVCWGKGKLKGAEIGHEDGEAMALEARML